MTIDDENSVYVGGLPYTASEEMLRREFSLYGSIVAVKVVNDRSVKGKCYGFVTFTNPRSAADAIHHMDGKIIGGRVVRVNEVTTRGGRFNPGQDRSQHSDWGRGREKERVYYRERDVYGDRYSDRSPEQYRSRERDRSRQRDRSREHDRSRGHYMDMAVGHEHSCDHVRAKKNASEREQDMGRELEDDADERSRGHDHQEREHKQAMEQEREMDGIDDYDRGVNGEEEQESKRPSRDRSSNSNEEYNFQVKEQLEGSIQMREELRREILEMEEKLEVKQKRVLDLQKKSKKLEDALISTKKLTSQRKKQLTKLHKGFLQVRECTEKLKSCEQELQSLVESAMTELGSKEEVLTNS